MIKFVQNKAWLCDMEVGQCIVFAPTRSKAKWIAVRSYWEAYERKKGQWPYVVARREPFYDKSVLRFDRQQAYDESYVMNSPRS